VLATSADDRNIALYDCRAATPIRKVILEMRTNAIAWNPMEAFNFTVANEDHNLYTFDMRKLKTALNVHKDHVSAVLDVDYSPTGREFVSGSYVLHFLRHLGVIDRLPFLCLSPLRFSCSLFPLQISKRRHENAVKMALTSSLFGVKQIRSHCAYLPVQSWAISRSVPH